MVATESHLKDIEWEVLQEPCQITKINPSPSLPRGSEKIDVWRDGSYKVKAKITGIAQKGDIPHYQKTQQPGAIIPPFMVKGSYHQGLYNYELNHCYIGGIHQHWTQNGPPSFEADLNTSEVKIKASSNSEVAWLTDWYINGPKNEFIFPRKTTRKMSQNFERLRNSIDETSSEFIGGSSESYSIDFAYIETDEVRFILSSVPKGLGPKWSNNIGIEYRKSFGELPKAEQREAIGEAVSFILGRQLLHVGYTRYDSRGELVEHVALSPWGNNVVSVCQKPDNHPISFAPHQLEKILNKVVPTYLHLRRDLSLKEVLWRYWISRNMPIGTNLPILSSALETLMKAWFRTTNSTTKGVYMPKKEFDQLLNEEFELISQKLNRKKFYELILRSIHKSNRQSFDLTPKSRNRLSGSVFS